MFQYQNGQSLDALEDAPADTPKNNQIISLLINNLIESTYLTSISSNIWLQKISYLLSNDEPLLRH